MDCFPFGFLFLTYVVDLPLLHHPFVAISKSVWNIRAGEQEELRARPLCPAGACSRARSRRGSAGPRSSASLLQQRPTPAARGARATSSAAPAGGSARSTATGTSRAGPSRPRSRRSSLSTTPTPCSSRTLHSFAKWISAAPSADSSGSAKSRARTRISHMRFSSLRIEMIVLIRQIKSDIKMSLQSYFP